MEEALFTLVDLDHEGLALLGDQLIPVSRSVSLHSRHPSSSDEETACASEAIESGTVLCSVLLFYSLRHSRIVASIT